MAATTTLLGLVTPTQGTLSGTWGDTVNYGISDYVDISVAGTLTLTNDGAVTLANTTGSSSGNSITSSLTGAGTVTAQFAIVRVTGTLTVAKVVTGPSYSKTYTVVNAATGGIVTFKASGQTGVSVAVGESAFVYFNGTDYVKLAGTVDTGVTTFSAGTTGFTPSTATSGAITLAGTLATTNGGTGLTSFTSGGVPYATSTSALTTGSALTFNGSALSVTGTITAAGQLATILSTNSALQIATSNSNAGALADNNVIAGNGTNNAIMAMKGTGFTSSGIFSASNAYFGGTGTSSTNLYSTSGNVNVYPASTLVATFNTTGLGIGTSSPIGKLSLLGAFGTTQTAGLTIASTGSTTGLLAPIAFYLQSSNWGTVHQATITAQQVSGTDSGANLIFSTSATGASTPTEYLRIASTGAFGLSGANYGTSGQVLTSGGSGAAPTWTTVSGGGGSPATPTVEGLVYGKMTASGGSPRLTALGYNAGVATTGVNNVFIGVSAGQANVAGTDSIAIGYQAMQNYTGADGLNIAIGSNALTTATSGTSYLNIAIGPDAMKLNTSGYGNIAMGYRSLENNTSGRFSTAIGYGALRYLTTGNDGSTAVGADACQQVTTGVYNVGVGGSAISSVTTGSYNTAMGYGALGAGSTTTSSSNVAIGYNALVTTGAKSNNVAVGRDSLYANTTGGNNVAIGRDALGANTTTSNLTAVGYQALLSNTTGEENTAVGYQALYTNTTNYRLTALGWKAGFACTGNESVFIGYRAGQSVSSGVANTLVGPYAGEYQNAITTGSNNVVLGYAGGLAAGTDSNEIFINTVYNASGKGSSTGFINPNGGGVYQGNNSSSWSTTSDQRLKKNIVDNNVGLDAINSIRVRNFEYRVESEITELSTNCAVQKTGVQLGVIAQELQAVLPECVKTESTGVLSVDTDNLTWYLVNAVKQLKAEFDAYKASHP